MASKEKLNGSFGSLIDTLTGRFDPLQPDDIVTEWTGLLVRCAACARDTDAWEHLPQQSDAFDPVVHGLDDATHAIVNAHRGNATEIRAALELTSTALGRLERLLG